MASAKTREWKLDIAGRCVRHRDSIASEIVLWEHTRMKEKPQYRKEENQLHLGS